MDINEQIRRLLILLPEVVRAKDGVPVAELSEKLGVEVAALPDVIEKLMLVGKPPFNPDDLLELYLEDDRVYAVLHQSLDRPPRFTHDEALALAVGAASVSLGDEVGPTSGSVLESALKKIESAMSEEELHRYRELTSRIALAHSAVPEKDVRAVIWRALEEGQAVEMVYYSAHRDELGRREVEPYGVFSHRGYWYLVAGPDGPDGYKLYRLDRVREAEAVGEKGKVRVPPSLSLDHLWSSGFGRWANDASARIRIERVKSRFARERYPADKMELGPDGSLEVRFDGASYDWLSSQVISLGGDAMVMEPEALARKVLEDTRRTRALYD